MNDTTNNDRQKEQADRSGARDFLVKCMVENLVHARHVENERLTFNSILTALIGGGLVFSFSAKEEPFFAVITISFLLLLTLFGYLLTKRWDDVFRGHQDKANEICSQLICEFADILGEGDFIAARQSRNLLYYFQHQPEHNDSMILNSLYRLKTRRLFSMFYLLLATALIGSLGLILYGNFGWPAVGWLSAAVVLVLVATRIRIRR